MTLTKNKPRQGPDLESIIGNLSNGLNAPASNSRMQEKGDSNEGTYRQDGLWDKFIDMLNDPEDGNAERSKLYAIDDDIVETLHQCSFGKPNVHVINSILRTFLIENLARLRELYRPRSKSLLDKYE